MDLITTIQSDFDVVEIFPIGIQTHQTVTLVIKEWGRIAVEKVVVHHSRIHKNGSIEHAHRFVWAKINEVFTSNCELGKAGVRAAKGTDLCDYGNFIVEVW